MQKPTDSFIGGSTPEERNQKAIEILSDKEMVGRYYEKLRAECTDGTILPTISRENLTNHIGYDPDLLRLVDAVYNLNPKLLGVSTETDEPVLEEPGMDEEFVTIQGPYIGPDGKERVLAPKYLPKHVFDAYTTMNEDYKQWLDTRDRDGLPKRPGLLIKSGYRSPAYQSILALRTIHEDGLEKTTKSLMPPGFSQHGRISECAIDILMMGDDFGIPRRSDGSPMEIDETIEGAWLLENAEKYGFWLPFFPDPKDPTSPLSATGIIIEPWHFQYVGAEKAAELMRVNNVREIFAARHAHIGVAPQKLVA